MSSDVYVVTPDALERLAKEKPPLKVFTFDYTLTGQLTITARDASEAYRQAIMWSKPDLGRNADLDMDPPQERGSVQ